MNYEPVVALLVWFVLVVDVVAMGQEKAREGQRRRAVSREGWPPFGE